MSTVSVYDVAQYILKKTGKLTAMKLQKLVYYSQAWSLVWTEKPLFKNRIEAWANGPVSPDLYKTHRKMYEVSTIDVGNPKKLTGLQRDVVDKVLKFYGDKPGQWLSDLSHKEAPWKNARKDLPNGEVGEDEITQVAMAEYYGSL